MTNNHFITAPFHILIILLYIYLFSISHISSENDIDIYS